MAGWHYAQLTITVDGRAHQENPRTIVWHEPGHGTGGSDIDSDLTIGVVWR